MVTRTMQMESEVEVLAGQRRLRGFLHLPPGAEGVVVFAHGSGSGRLSPRNQFVAGVLQAAGLATLLLDLLEADEAQDRSKVFDIELLAERLHSTAQWLRQEPATKALRAGAKPLEGRLVLESGGGEATVVVRCGVPVRPFPEGVLAGAVTPRQVAERAKASPKAVLG